MPTFKLRLLFSAILLSAVVLGACGSAKTVTPISPTPTLPIKLIFPTTGPSCTTVSSEPTPGPETPSLFGPVTDTDHIRGSQNATITLMDYSDYQDPRSGAFAEVAKHLFTDHPEDIRLVTRPFPILVLNDKAGYSAVAAEAAGEQGKFWEMHDLLYAQQASWIKLSVEDFNQWVIAQASTLGLDAVKFKSDLTREDLVNKVKKAWEDGQKINLPGTPVVILNGNIYQGPRDFTSLNDVIQLILLGKRQFTSCPPNTVDPAKQYLATLHTEKGDITIELFADKAPVTVNSFIFLARKGWYDNITFHRVIPKIYAQTGDPSGTGKGNPGYYIITEITPTLTFNKPGMVAMVNSGPDTSGSQFFITYAPTEQYDGQYTIFGQVLTGMDVLQSLTPRNAQLGVDTPPGNKLLSITIQEK
jgi:cyclophilin family peptidyl-prolyl cis-trans isomerase/protein-disulfide isomerase